MKRFSKTLYFVFTAVVLSLFISCAVYAGEYITWEISSDGQTLTGGGVTYEYYGVFEDLDTDKLLDSYTYENDVYFQGNSYRVYSYEKNGDILRLSHYGEPARTYVTKQGKKILDGFFSGKNVCYKLWASNSNASSLDEATVSSLMQDYISSVERTNVSVQVLRTYELREITMHDELYYFTYTVGAFYISPSKELYYINYMSLGNQYFDADGNFSYRSGNVDLIKVDDATEKVITDALNNSEYIQTEYKWEDSGIYYSEEEAISLTPVFYVGLIVLGFVFPLPFLVCGLIFPRLKKFGRPKYWYIMSATSAAWILASTVFTIIVLMAQ